MSVGLEASLPEGDVEEVATVSTESLFFVVVDIVVAVDVVVDVVGGCGAKRLT